MNFKNEILINEVIDKMLIEESFNVFLEDKSVNQKIEIIKNQLHTKYNNIKFESEKNENIDKFLNSSILSIKKIINNKEFQHKLFGEVMSPIDEVVIPMINTLPEWVWSNPNLKWLDSCAGIGNFQFVIIKKLMDGLSVWEPDEEKRYAHIVENMIYIGELQAKNAFINMVLFNVNGDLKINIYNNDFLDKKFDENMKNEWNVDGFDIIIGNPPFNSTSSGAYGKRDLWDKFVLKSIDLLNKNGFLVFVHPPKWRMPEHKLFNVFKNNNLIYLEIHSKLDGEKVFKATTRYDFYCLQKSNYNGSTKIIDELGFCLDIDITKWDWLPNYEFKNIGDIISKDTDSNCEIIYDRSMYGNEKEWMSKERDEKYNLPCVYGMYKDMTCSYLYSSSDKGHFGESKLILGIGEKLYPLIDYEGQYGLTNNAFAIKCNVIEDLGEMKKAIESEKFKKIIKATKWNNFQTSQKMFKSFKKDFWKNFI